MSPKMKKEHRFGGKVMIYIGMHIKCSDLDMKSASQIMKTVKDQHNSHTLLHVPQCLAKFA